MERISRRSFFTSFLPGIGLGGSILQQRSRTIGRYGRKFIPPEVTIQDWGVTAAELEPHFDRFEYLLGTTGKGGRRP